MEQEGGGRTGRATEPRDGISLLLAPVCCSHRSQLRGEGRLQEIAGSVTKGEEPVI